MRAEAEAEKARWKAIAEEIHERAEAKRLKREHLEAVRLEGRREVQSLRIGVATGAMKIWPSIRIITGGVLDANAGLRRRSGHE